MARLRPQYLHVVEATLIGLFFIQALRFLIGLLYSHVAGAAVVSGILATDPSLLSSSVPDAIDPASVSRQISFAIYMALLPLVALILGRFRSLLVVSAALVAFARAWMLSGGAPAAPYAAALAVGGGLLYVALLIRHRARLMPYFFILGLGIDQLFRAFGNTLDPSWSPAYEIPQLALSVIAAVASLAGYLWARAQTSEQRAAVYPDNGLLPFWGGIGLGALLFLQLALFSLPNAIAGRAGVDYTLFVPLVMAATVLPLVPWVRARARGFIALFDGLVRGWVWLLITALLVVFGVRFPSFAGGVALVVAQFAISLLWWWLARPQAEKERNFTAVWVVLAALVFGMLLAADFFTYEYAFVRDFTGNFAFLNDYIPPLLRGFRGLGLGVLLLGVFLSTLPMTQTHRRIPWAERKDTPTQSLFMLALTIALVAASTYFARPPLVQPIRGVDSFRVGSYNIHSGFDEFFTYNLEAIAQTIDQSGANVVLLQEVETGRMTSFGVDQSLWLARRLGMDRRFYGTNEGLQGLAVLSKVPIVYHQGTLLASVGNQTGVQHVQVSTDGVSAVSFYNTWLGLLVENPGGRTIAEQEQDQEKQLNEIFTLIARDYPDLNQVRIVVGGTFNNIPGSPLIELMRVSGFNDPFAGRPQELSATLWRANAHARLDFLFLRNVLPLGAGVMESNASDHRMLVSEILINRAAS